MAVKVMHRQSVVAGYDQARDTLRRVLASMSADDLRRRSAGTRWTNKQLLVHMVCGYLVTIGLIRMAKVLGLLPRGATARSAALLDLGRGAFDQMNYVGFRIGANAFSVRMLQRVLDGATRRLARQLAAETPETLARGMSYPTTWDPFFKDYMTVADLYSYVTKHFTFHRDQLSTAG